MPILNPMKTMPLKINFLFSPGFVKPILILALNLLFFTQTHAAEALKIKPHEVPDACDAEVAQVRVTVNGVGSGGVLNVELYDDPENFLFKKGRKRKVRIPVVAEGQ